MTAASLYAPFVGAGDTGENTITLSVEGVHCPACIQKIESSLAGREGVKTARLNYTTKRLNIVWNGPAERIDDFIGRLEGMGYKARPYEAAKTEASDTEYARFLRLCLGVSGFATGNIMLLSFALWMTTTNEMGLMTRELFHFISALIAVPTVIFAGRPFFRSAWSVLKKGRTNMDVPISLGITLATVMSLFEMTRGAEHVFFDSAVMLIFFLLIGRYLDFLALANARQAAGNLVSMLAGSATVLQDGVPRTMLIRDLREGMEALVGVGERIPADGMVLEGVSGIDTSPVTGESLPVAVKAGDTLYSGTINISAPLKIRILRAAENSLLADVIRMMEKAEQGQAKYVRIADRAAKLYTPVVHVLAAATFAGWMLLGHLPWQDCLMIAVTVLIITCPCALGLAVPVVQMLAVGRLMQKGVMVKTGDALERLASVDTVMLDKTGTLTLGEPELDSGPDDRRLAASMAVHSKHPLSKAIARSYEGEIIPLDVKELEGLGLETVYEGRRIRLGSRAWCGDKSAADDGRALELWLDRDGQPPIRFTFADPLRTDAPEFVRSLIKQGMKVVMASGDREPAVRHVADKLGIDEWHAAMKPADKFSLLGKLKNEGRKVLMIGDGLNDAPVLAGADVSASPASGLDIARNAADLVFTGKLCAPVLLAYKVAAMSQKLVTQNFMLAVLYNITAIPMAVAGYVTPMVAAIAMSASSLIVIANAFRLKTVI